MSEQTSTTETAPETNPTSTPSAETANTWETVFEGKTPEQVQNEIEKWKHFSRKNEDELNQLKQANMTDAEKAIEAAKAAGRAESGDEITKLRLENAAIKAGVPEHLLKVLDVSKLVVDGEIQTDLLSSLAEPKAPQFTKTASDLNLGAQSSSSAGQWTREQLARANAAGDYAAINKAREEGKLNDLMSGRIR